MVDMESVLARLLDVAAIAVGAAVASLLFKPGVEQRALVSAVVMFEMALATLLLSMFGLYRLWRGQSKWWPLAAAVCGWFAVQACGLAVTLLLHRSPSISRFWWLSWTALTTAGIVATHLSVHALLGRRRTGKDQRTVAVVGAGEHCDAVLARVAATPADGFRAVATLSTAGDGRQRSDGLPAFVALRAFADWVREQRIDEVWLALPISDETTLLRVLDEFSGDLVNVRFLPDVSRLVMFDRNVVDLLGAPAINLIVSPMTPAALLQKAIFDRIFAFVMLIALAPVMVPIALAVKLTSKGPVFFTQQRKGANGRVFRIYKFRSMRVHTEKPGEVRQATRGDPRITRLGAFLRRTSLDELPQFLNVLRGEMSVVGPRPHAIEHDEHYRTIVDGYIHRYRIKPGITGWAQINGFRGETEQLEKMQARVEHDLYYLRNWSFGLDMRIILATVVKGMRHTNAY
ncbi:undecaprenyl-phosphate glucose phosphotransferase [Burkholderia sp. SRS-W-2-2016]|uniref:undecaprenyl-phosphate glucose phosphotransferase n=1 Tax=Burkholderia sp. SRS-W-2-2016 TaxID=1926878 RepID=UPI00094B0D39|nr:undecaprenyl-phosphate glucose phosphotransferase [Burkholderia sp. SRS-W-2-2016]OLL29183.1 undecaprenyl-phosphate glucose phosphotransferase [Burkholderia sp. SRS-W-2-2016]